MDPFTAQRVTSRSSSLRSKKIERTRIYDLTTQTTTLKLRGMQKGPHSRTIMVVTTNPQYLQRPSLAQMLYPKAFLTNEPNACRWGCGWRRWSSILQLLFVLFEPVPLGVLRFGVPFRWQVRLQFHGNDGAVTSLCCNRSSF